MIWRTVKPMGVGNDGAIGANFDLRGLLVHVDGNGVALDIGFDGEVRKQLDGQNPGFEGAVLLPARRRVRPQP